MSAPQWWPAPAKINLFLHVLGRRADGYHDLQTLFQFLSLQDEIGVTHRDDGLVRRRSEHSNVPEAEDLTVRAAALLKATTHCRHGVDIELVKRIPVGAGLGGGSSDCAATLHALNQLWGLGLCVDSLAALGATLGADVPVFLRGHAAWGEGVGERLTPVALREDWYTVLIPDCHVSTADVFAAPALTRNTRPLKIADLSHTGESSVTPWIHLSTIFERTRNDCQALVRELYPPVNQALAWLEAKGVARMTGTGAAVFAPADTEAAARASLADCPSQWVGFVSRGLNESPLLRGI